MPYNFGNIWNSSLVIGEQYSDPQIASFKDSIILHNDYQIKRNLFLNTFLGKLNCIEVDATSKSPLGVTKTKIYFNNTYGIIKMNFNCLNGININMSLLTLTNNSIYNNHKSQ